jgi:hypothetical protein
MVLDPAEKSALEPIAECDTIDDWSSWRRRCFARWSDLLKYHFPGSKENV